MPQCLNIDRDDVEYQEEGEEHPGTITACRVTVKEEDADIYDSVLRIRFQQLSVRNAETIYDRVADIEDVPTRHNQGKVEIRDYVRFTAAQIGIVLPDIPLPP
jgi:hypothetical protein